MYKLSHNDRHNFVGSPVAWLKGVPPQLCWQVSTGYFSVHALRRKRAKTKGLPAGNGKGLVCQFSNHVEV